MGKACTIFIIFLATFQLQGQLAGFNFVPIEFDEIKPIWGHVTSDSTIIGYVSDENPIIQFDGYSHIHGSVTLITEDALYKASRSRQNNDIAGSIIEKLNIETGELIWKQVIDLRTEDRIEYVMDLRLKEDSLIVYSIYLDEGFSLISTMLGNATGHLSLRVHSIETGELLSRTVPDTTLSDLVVLRTPFYSDSEFHFLDDESIQVMRLGSDSAGYFLVIDTMTMDGVKVNPTNTLSQELELNWSDTGLQRANKFKKDPYFGDIYFLNYYRPNSQGSEHRSAQLLRYDKQGREELSISFDDFDNLKAFNLVKITRDHLMVMAFMEDNTVKLLIVNKDTGLIEKTVKNPDINPTNLISQDFYLDDNGEILLVSYDRIGDDYNLNFYLSEDERFVLQKRLTMSAAGYQALVSGIYALDESDFLIEFIYREVAGLPIPKGRFKAMIRLTSEDLGLSTSVEDLAQNLNSAYSFYPNPTMGALTLNSEISGTFRIVIYDFLGREVLAKKDLGNYNSLDLSGFTPGNYLIQFVTEKGVFNEHLIMK